MSETTYLVRHHTAYQYENPAQQSHNLACLIPRTFPGQTVREIRLEIHPKPNCRFNWLDVYGNAREFFELSVPHETLEVTLFARVNRTPPSAGACELTWEQCVLPDGNAWDAAQSLGREFRFASPLLPLPDHAGFETDDLFTPGRPVLETLDAFMTRVHDSFKYDPEATTTFTPLNEVYEKKAGVCQDFAHAAIAELRRRGFAAGYVSGYLETLPAPGREKLRGADATHAWYSVRIPGHGWVHFDPTNNMRVGARHIITAWGRDYGDVAPLKGVLLGGGAHEITIEVDVWSWPEQVPEDMREIFAG